MSIQVELFGIPRLRAGTAIVEIDTDQKSLTLGELLSRLVESCPALERECIEDGRMKEGYVANLDGQQFVSDPNFTVESGRCVLIMSADAGG